MTVNCWTLRSTPSQWLFIWPKLRDDSSAPCQHRRATTKGGNPFAKEFSENINTMRLILNPISLASVVGLMFGFLSVMALLPGHPRDSIEIRKTEYGDRWPFAIQQGRLRCEGAGAVILTVQGKDYAVNGMASTRYASMQPVWK